MNAQPAMALPAITSQLLADLQTALLAWYDLNKRDLPWRRSRDPYAIWVSEVMLQQTQVIAAEPYYRRFMDRFPDVGSLAAGPLQDVLKLWQGLGYYSRARHLHQAARIIRESFGGTLPDQWHHLRTLPGVGDYIASAVASIAFGGAHAVADGNVKRVLARLFTRAEPVNTPAGQRYFQHLAALLLERNRPGDYNQSLMELGARMCVPRGPQCAQCPLKAYCAALRDGVTAQFPRRRQKAALPLQHAATVLLMRGGRILMRQRPDKGLLGGFWELPGGPVPSDADPQAAAVNHIMRGLGLQARGLLNMGTVRHTYTHFKLELVVFRCTAFTGRLKRDPAVRWVEPDQLDRLPLHKAVLKALQMLKIEGGSDLCADRPA